MLSPGAVTYEDSPHGVDVHTGCFRVSQPTPRATSVLDAYLPELSAETTEYLLKGMPPQFSDAYHMQKGRAAMGAGDKLAELANLPAEKLAELKAAGERVMRGEL